MTNRPQEPRAAEPTDDERRSDALTAHTLECEEHGIEAQAADFNAGWKALAKLTPEESVEAPPAEREPALDRIRRMAVAAEDDKIDGRNACREIVAMIDAAKESGESVEASKAGVPTDEHKALTEIHNWLVCWPIATAEDMAQSFEHMEKVAGRALGYVPEGVSAAEWFGEEPTRQLTDAQIIEIRDEHLPNQGDSFDCIAFARAILLAGQAGTAEAGGEARDAARYRWLTAEQARVISRGPLKAEMAFRFWCSAEVLGQAIDAALSTPVQSPSMDAGE